MPLGSANFSFANDATRIAQSFVPNMVQMERMQTSIEYEKNVSMLSRMWNAFVEWDRNLSGSGSYTNWNGNGLIQFYRSGGPSFGQAIHVKGRPRLIDINTMPGFMGVAGRGGRGRYIGRTNGATVANDLLGATGLGAKSFQAGHNSNLLDIAIEAVKGNVGVVDRPVAKAVTDASLESKVEAGNKQLTKINIIDSVAVSLYTLLKKSEAGIAYPDSEGLFPPHDSVWHVRIFSEGDLESEYFTGDRDTISGGYHYDRR